MKYIDIIENTELIDNVETTITTGDVDYPGTAIEVIDCKELELFHFVVDSKGDKQILIFGKRKNYRLSLDRLEELIKIAKNNLKFMPE